MIALTITDVFSGVVCQAREEHAKVSHSYTLLTDKFDFLEDKIIYDRMVLTNIVSSLEFEKSQREQELERKQENLQALKETGLQAYGTEKSEGMFDTQESRDKMRDHLNASLLALEKVNDLAIEIENDKKNIDGIFKKLLESKKQLVSITDSLKTCSETIESCRYIKKMLAEKRDEMYSLEFTQKEQVARELIALCEKVMNVRNNSDEFIAFVKEQKNMAAPLKKRGRPPLSEGGAAKRVKAAK
ncbi:hypothetical protein GCK72_007099 [Caenorhabditis remanei]|uniref:Uncharacterized protein n=1 Tax=Caenorhabditis remanei TaxID=31234 RepID=A0A6A5HGJ7_CAERE|nr:hypothetical protein GCK72_007099 [Caenorhabditis remanei]KAF1767140.1 hypothetical protein GCK72_007099 [Caenorhabditis remanei]